MKAKQFLEQINELPDDLLLEAQPKVKPGKVGFSWKRWGGVAVCCCVVLGAVLLVPLSLLGNQTGLPQPVDYSQVVNYSDLSFGDTYLPEGLEISSGNITDSVQGIAGSVEEELVSGFRPMALLEVTVTDVRTKDYYYDTPDPWPDDPDRVLHDHDQTLLYDFQIDRVWYGGPFQAGESLTGENPVALLDPGYLMEIGGRYVVPVYYDGDLLKTAQNRGAVSGDIHRESPYYSLDFYQPPIQLTADGEYVMPDNWMLLSAYSRRIEIDLSPQPEIYGLYADRMRLVTPEDFTRQMEILVDWFGGKEPESLAPEDAVPYSSLSFGEIHRPDGLSSNQSEVNTAFFEAWLYHGTEDSQGPIEFWEVTVTDMTVKDYRYDVMDSFVEAGQVTAQQRQTLVYQVQIQQVWSGESVQPGETVLLEELSYGQIDTGCLLSIGGRYVLPIVRHGDTYPEWREVVSGDVSLSSPYGIYVPYQPPIQRTADGDYVLPAGWTTLTEISQPVKMDVALFDSGKYSFRMCLVEGDDFARQMELLLQKIET